MNKPRFYLAHPFAARHWVREWELALESEGFYDLINPFYDLNRDDVAKIDNGERERYEGLSPEDIVFRDLEAIAESDGVLAIIDGNVSYGTIIEICCAFTGLDDNPAEWPYKPVWILCTNGHHAHPWLTLFSSQIVTSQEQAAVLLAKVSTDTTLYKN